MNLLCEAILIAAAAVATTTHTAIFNSNDMKRAMVDIAEQTFLFGSQFQCVWFFKLVKDVYATKF